MLFKIDYLKAADVTKGVKRKEQYTSQMQVSLTGQRI